MNPFSPFLLTPLLAMLGFGAVSAELEAQERPRVMLETALGPIEIEVFDDKAPLSAASFLSYVDENRYAGQGFYRVVRQDNDRGTPIIEVVQGGVLKPDPSGGGGIAHESTELTGIKHTDGVVSLARTEPGTGSAAAFFICIGDQPSLDFGGMRNKDGLGFAAFARVINGMDVVRKIQQIRSEGDSDDGYTAGQILRDPVIITKAYRIK